MSSSLPVVGYVVKGGTGVRELMRGLATLPPKVDPGAFSGQRQGWKTRSTASVCVAGVHCWEILG